MGTAGKGPRTPRTPRTQPLGLLQSVTPGTSPPSPASPASPAVTWLHGLLSAIGSGPKGRTVRQCPAHSDSAPSLSIGQGDDGRALVHCFAGCGFGAILKALCLWGEYLLRPPPMSPEGYARAFVRHPGFAAISSGGSHPTSRGMRLVAQHPYGDRWWLLRYRHPVTGAKELSWESINPKGERVPGLLGTLTRDLPLYRESDIKKGMALDEVVLLVESESSVDALQGWYATTWAGGAASPPIERLQAVLGGYEHLVVIPDTDNPGLDCLERLIDAGLVSHLLLGEVGEDARDLYERVGPEEFRRLVEMELATNAN